LVAASAGINAVVVTNKIAASATEALRNILSSRNLILSEK
jgi:hypothetical protein